MKAAAVDAVRLNFDASGLMVLNVILGLVMFGIALDLKIDDFKRVFRMPKAVLIGLFAQLVLLPAMTFALTWILRPHPSMALGMILVAACPGGNTSNFIAYLARGNASLSITMTAICNLCSLVTTPFHIAFWGSLQPPTRAILKQVHLEPLKMLGIMMILMVIPLFLGMGLAARKPHIAAKLRKPFRIASIVFFLAFIAIAMGKNWGFFLRYIGLVFGVVALHNGLAFLLGYGTGLAAGLEGPDRRAISIEVGIQNSGLGLILIFNFFGGLGGMAVIAAWWGVWHLISGMALALWWSRRPVAAPAASPLRAEA